LSQLLLLPAAQIEIMDSQSMLVMLQAMSAKDRAQLFQAAAVPASFQAAASSAAAAATPFSSFACSSIAQEARSEAPASSSASAAAAAAAASAPSFSSSAFAAAVAAANAAAADGSAAPFTIHANNVSIQNLSVIHNHISPQKQAAQVLAKKKRPGRSRDEPWSGLMRSCVRNRLEANNFLRFAGNSSTSRISGIGTQDPNQLHTNTHVRFDLNKPLSDAHNTVSHTALFSLVGILVLTPAACVLFR
jgi:hypothetical protein